MPRRRKLPRIPDGYKPGKPKTPDWRYEQYIPDWRKHGRKRPPQGVSMRRRGQKPWNKVPRTEKFWVPNSQLEAANVNETMVLTANSPRIVAQYSAEQLNANYPSVAGSPGLRALQNGKLHRFQGDMWCWLDPVVDFEDVSHNEIDAAPGGQDVAPNIAFVTYVWMKLDEEANFNTLNNPLPAASFNPRPGGDLVNLLLRDDCIKWGTIPVFGIVPRMLTAQIGGGSLTAALVGNHGMYLQGRVARIPFPRVPKTGYTLRKGESLLCYAATWPGPGGAAAIDPLDAASHNRDVYVYSVTRALCSN